MNNYSRFICLFLFSLIAAVAHAQYPINVQVNVAPPYPIRLSDFTAIESNVLVNLQNNSGDTYSVALVGTLLNETTGASITSDLSRISSACITALPGTTMLSGEDLRELFNPDNLIYRGLSRTQIRGDEALPEGRYTLCIRVMECNMIGKFLSEIPSEPFGCSGFDVNYVDPPVLISPICDGLIATDDIQMTIAWTQVIPTRAGVMIDYTIRIVEVEPVTRNPYDAMLTSPAIFNQDISGTTVYNLMLQDEILLEPGRKYAIQITAKNAEGEVAFRNDGKSEVCTFKYGNSLALDGFAIAPNYPLNGDVIPFDFFPIVVKFNPYSNEYNRFTYDFNISSSGFRDTHSGDLRWGFGPMESQRRATGFSDITELQSQHIALYKNQLDAGVPQFNRGKLYTWNASIDMEARGSSSLHASPSASFGIGMGPSLLQTPANESTVSAGAINFAWQTAEAPQKLLPDFGIVQARSTPATFFNGIVDERWVIEVSKQQTFDTILHTLSGRLGATIDLMSDEVAAKDELYKQVEEQFTITENGKYYWRVRWMISPENISNNSSYATSAVWNFTIGTPDPTVARTDTPEDPEPGACVSNCIADPITNRNAASGLTVGTNLMIGKFTMNVRTITSSASNRFTGEGVITIAFLNSVKILVDFTSIQYNAEGKIFAGTVRAKADREFVNEEVRTRAGEVLSMSETDARELGNFISDGERLMSAFTGAREIGMPIGIDREIDGHRYVVGVVEMEFTPERANLGAVMSLDFPTLGNKLIALGAKDICFSPGGLGDEGRLYLARDWTIVQEGETQFAFKGSESADTTRATYVSWDCRGFKCAQVRGEVTFPRNMFVPDNADGTIGEGNVKGLFGVKVCRDDDWIAMVTIDPFQVNGLTGWGWNASNAYLDFSDTENPPGFRLPSGYGDTTLLDARLTNTWQGFYMERIEVKLPPEFASDVTPDGRTSFGVFNTIIDGTGLSTSIRAMNILEVSEGNFEGWGFAIDTLNIDFVSNTFTEAGMAGRIGMPIFEAGDNLKYRMALGFDDESDEFNYQFRVFTRDTLNIPMWDVARMYFKPNSSIEIGLNDPVKGDHITATLHGGIQLVGDLGAISSVAFSGINFEGLYLSTYADSEGRYFKADSIYFAHASPQKSASGFPVSIENIGLNLNTLTRPGIEFDFMLNFQESNTTIGASVTLGVFATFEHVGDGFEVGFGGVDVGAISIDVDVSVMHLQGSLEFYRDDPVYGNGTRGNIRVDLPMGISGELTAYFGTYGNATRGQFGTNNYYAYWLVDGTITFPGLPIFSGVAIYGFGGGAYHHMSMASELPNPQSTQDGSGRTSIQYVPNFTTGLGLKFVAIFGTHPSDEAFNMDVHLQAEFNNSFGLNFISVGGDGYFMTSRTQRGDAKVWANINLMFDNRPAEGPKFTGNFDVFVRVGDFLHGAGEGDKFVAMEFYVDHETWHMYMGTPDNRAGLIADVKVVQAQLTTYLMVGHGIPVSLPQLPDRIQAVLGGGGLESASETTSAAASRVRSAADEAAYNSGTGFAFGAALALDVNLDFAIFYASLGLDLGFDLSLMKPAPGSVFCAETGAPPRGIDGYYIQGQVFAGLYGEMGVQVDLFFVKGKFPFIQLGAAAVMQGNFPDPSGFRGRAGLYYSILGGMVEGRCNFEMEIGDKCTFVIPNPLSGMDFIADIAPQGGSRDQSCFSSPAVSFNLPVEKYLEFPVIAADGSEVTRTFFPFVDVFEFKKVGSRNGVNGSRNFESNNTVLKFRLDEMLEGNTVYEVRIVIKSREHFPNGTNQLVKNGDGSVWLEERTVRFTTGPVPDFIPLDQVAYTYPVDGQYYFLKGEGQATTNSGAIRLSSGSSISSSGKSSTSTSPKPANGVMQLENPVNLIFSREIDGRQYKYFVRYLPVSGGDKVEIDLSYTTGRVMSLPLPELENETMYAVQLVRKYVPQALSPLERLGSQITEQNSRLGISGALLSSTVLSRTVNGVNVNMRTTGQQLLPGETVGLDEKLLYKFYFRTSRHNTLQEKLAAANVSATYVNAFIAEGFKINTYLQEPFDEFEIQGKYKNGTLVMKPLLNLTDPWLNSYHTSLVLPSVYDVQSRALSIVRASGYSSQVTIASLNRHGKGIPPKQTVSVVGNNSTVTTPIAQWQIQNEARRNSEYNQSSGNSSDAIQLSSTASQALGSASLVLNGGHSFNSAGISIAPSGPSSNFEMVMSTSAYVWGDFLDLQRSLARAMSFAPWPGTRFPIRTAIEADRILYPKVNSLLRQNVLTYRFNRGTYTIDMRYQRPIGNNQYTLGTQATKTFTY
jgi:TANFOR domain-containing protein